MRLRHPKRPLDGLLILPFIPTKETSCLVFSRLKCCPYLYLSLAEYEKRYHEQQIKYLEKRVAKFGFQLTPISP